MKKLVVLFTVLLFAGFCSAQTGDSSYESGYMSGYAKVTGVYPKTIPTNSQWVNLDMGNNTAKYGSKEQQLYNSDIKMYYNRGYARGSEDAKRFLQLAEREKSDSVPTETKKK